MSDDPEACAETYQALREVTRPRNLGRLWTHQDPYGAYPNSRVRFEFTLSKTVDALHDYEQRTGLPWSDVLLLTAAYVPIETRSRSAENAKFGARQRRRK